MEKRNRNRIQKERIVEEESKKSPFQKMLEERAKRLEMLVRPQFSHVFSQTCRREALKMLLCFFQEAQTEEGGHSSEDSGHCSPEPESEFLKVHAQLTAGKFSS